MTVSWGPNRAVVVVAVRRLRKRKAGNEAKPKSIPLSPTLKGASHRRDLAEAEGGAPNSYMCGAGDVAATYHMLRNQHQLLRH